jgi:arabinan endo-1,5-alpha-L-arabinosidase
LKADVGSIVWENQGKVVHTTSSSNYNAIDPHIIEDEEGIPWLSFGSFWTGIKLIKLNPTTGKPTDQEPVISLANRGGPGIEAPTIFHRNGFYYLFVSFDKCCAGSNSTYNIRVGRSKLLQGPYSDSQGKAMMQGGGDVIDAGDERWKGPGHNDIFVERDTVFLVNHAYDAERNGTATLFIRPLYWTEDHWPTLDSQAGKITTRLWHEKRVLKHRSNPKGSIRTLKIRMDGRAHPLGIAHLSRYQNK